MKISKINLGSCLLMSLLLLNSCDSDDDSTPLGPVEIPIPATLTISEVGLYPEGIDFDENKKQFVVSALAKSEIGLVNPITGAYTTLVTDAGLASPAGVFTDETRNRLIVASGKLPFSTNSSNTPEPSAAYVGIYNLETGVKIEGIDLQALLPEGSGAFANDVAVDNDGNIYITDSFSPVIYKVDGESLEASVFIEDEANFTPGEGAFGLNGIIYTNGYLIVGKLDDGNLFKINLEAPNEVTKIDVAPFVGADGLELLANGNIAITENGLGAEPGVHVISSDNNFDTAESVSYFAVDAEKFPTTAVQISSGETFVLNAYLSKALNGDLGQETFTILKAE